MGWRGLTAVALLVLIVGCGALSATDAPAGGVAPEATGAPTAGAPPAATAPPAGAAAPEATAVAAAQVVFPGATVSAELARTDAERTKGLGGHAPLGQDEGMLFIFPAPAPYAFWMKGMTFPLDIIWIGDGQVVHLEHDLPPSGPDETDATRKVYTPRAPARYVLEVNAGYAAAHGIGLGAPVQITGI